MFLGNHVNGPYEELVPMELLSRMRSYMITLIPVSTLCRSHGSSRPTGVRASRFCLWQVVSPVFT